MPNPLDWLGMIRPSNDDGGQWYDPTRKMMYESEQKFKQDEWRRQNPRKAAILEGAANVTDFVGNLIGVNPQLSQTDTAGRYGELAGAAADLIPGKAALAKGISLAGMPFAFYKKSGRVGEGLSRAQRGTWDVMDEARVGGRERGNIHGPGVYSFEKPEPAAKYHASMQEEGMPTVGRVRTLEPEAKNVLDLVEPNPVDIIKYIGTFPEQTQGVFRQYFKEAMEKGHTSDEAYGQLGKILQQMAHGDIENIKTAGFDAIRYPYGGEVAWMTPHSTPMYDIGSGKKVPFNQSALNARRESIAPSGPQISVAPENFRPPEGAVSPSGRRIKAPSEPTEPKTSTPKRMSIAELMATPATKTGSDIKVKTKSGETLTLEEIRRRLNR